MAVGVGDQPHDSMTSTTIEEEVTTAATPVPTPAPTPSYHAPKQEYPNQSYREKRISELEANNNTNATYNFITIGSSKKDVARIQGTPSAIDVMTYTEIWRYKYSTITFRDNKVIEWDDISDILKVRYVY
jgi:hypothetical protein